MTNEELLNEVNTAISTVLVGGQDYSIDTGTGSRTFTRADLGELRELKTYLEAEVSRDNAGGINVQYGVPQ